MNKPIIFSVFFFILTAIFSFGQGEWIEVTVDPETGLRTGKIQLNGEIYDIQPEANLSGTYLKGADLRRSDLRGADLSEANLGEANLSEANFVTALLEKSNLEGANLKGANLERTRLSGANFNNANLEGANFKKATLEGAELVNSNLNNTSFEKANLRGTELFGVDLSLANLGSIISGSSKANFKDIEILKPAVENNSANLTELNSKLDRLFGGISPNFELIWKNQSDPDDLVTMEIYFPEGTIGLEPPNIKSQAIEGSILTITKDSITNTFEDPQITFRSDHNRFHNRNYPLDFTKELIGQNGFGIGFGGDFNIFNVGDWNGVEPFTVSHKGDDRFRLVSMKLKNNPTIFNNYSKIKTNETEIDSLKEDVKAIKSQLQTLIASVAEKDRQIAFKDRIIATLEKRPTIEQVRDARAGSVVLTVEPDGNNITLGLTIEQSDNLTEWTKLDGEMTRTIPIPEGKKFYRFALDK